MAEVSIVELGAMDIRERIDSGTSSCVEMAEGLLKYAKEADKSIHAFAYLEDAAVMQQAQILDDHRMRGAQAGSLFGIPIAIKDAIDTFDMPAEYGSKLHAGRQPRWDSAVARRLREQGAILFGKTKMPEFCLGKPADTVNPRQVEHTPGGSSSGSAAAVAAGLVPVAVGTQTVGSVIRPASFCGVIGFKPTRGLISRSGLQPLSKTMDQVGVFGRSVEDVALVAEVLIGADEQDELTQGILPRPLLKVCQEEPPFEPKFVFMRTPFWQQMDKDAQEAFEALVEELGDLVVTIDLPESSEQVWKIHNTIVEAEFAQVMRDSYLHSKDALSADIQSIIERGLKISATDYLDALNRIEPVRDGFDEFFERFDAIITPASLGAAPKGLDSTGSPIMSALWSFTGMPCISLPLLQSANEMPLGVQLVGRHHDDARLLRTSRWLMKRFN